MKTNELPPLPTPKFTETIRGVPCITVTEHEHLMRAYALQACSQVQSEPQIQQLGWVYCYQGQEPAFSYTPQPPSIPKTHYWQVPVFDTEQVHALQARAQVQGEPVYWEWRHLSTHPNTVDFGKWSEWKRVEARSAIFTAEDELRTLRRYIADGYKYELRALYTTPQPAQATQAEAQQPAAAEPVRACQSCGADATHEAGSDETSFPGAYCDNCGPRTEALRTAIQQAEAQQPATGEPVGYMNEGHIHELAMRRLPYGYVYPEAGAGASTAVYTRPAPSVPADVVRDAERFRFILAAADDMTTSRYKSLCELLGVAITEDFDLGAAIDAAMLAA